MRYLSFCVLLAGLMACHKTTDPTPVTPVTPVFIKGVDLSFTPEIAQSGFVYTDNGVAMPILTMLKSHGVNTVRIRLWNHPADAHSSLAEVTQFAKAVRAAGMKWWLDFHYSDTWADPGKQGKPAAWVGVSGTQLADSLYAYTKNTLTYLNNQQVPPDYIQLGNEINAGMLWEDGHVASASDPRWAFFKTLLQQGAKACREAAPKAGIILHYAGYSSARDFFLQIGNVDYDIIGLSYYPWWHGQNVEDVPGYIATLHTTFKKPVLIAETAYPWTLQYNDFTNNSVGAASQLSSGYPATPDGQAAFLKRLNAIITANSNQTDSGICYWAPDWVAFKGTTATNGSPWENLALFDFQGNLLPGAGAF
jgi:arabinogalactan endo-1,4-beta-galactosidase